VISLAALAWPWAVAARAAAPPDSAMLAAAVRAEYLTRHVRGRGRDRDDFGWYVLEAPRVMARLQLVARQEDFQRPSRTVSPRLRGQAWAAGYDVAPNRVRLLLELSRRHRGARQVRSTALIAQIQAQF